MVTVMSYLTVLIRLPAMVKTFTFKTHNWVNLPAGWLVMTVAPAVLLPPAVVELLRAFVASMESCVLSMPGVTPSSPEKFLSDALMMVGGDDLV